MSLLAELRNKKKALATAIPAIPATRKGESGGGIARIAGIAVATETNQKNESANDVDFSAWPLPTLDDEQQPLAIAIPAIPATRKAETGGGIARIAGIAVAAVDTVITRSHVAGSDGVSVVMRTNEGAVEYARLVEAGEQDAFHRTCAFEDALQALVACGWTGVSAVNVARAISAGVTDEAMLTAMLEAPHD